MQKQDKEVRLSCLFFYDKKMKRKLSLVDRTSSITRETFRSYFEKSIDVSIFELIPSLVVNSFNLNLVSVHFDKKLFLMLNTDHI